jgi:hypothetical protein
MVLGFLKPVGGNMRLRYARPGYDANDLTLPGNQVAFDSANAGVFSVYAQGLWRGAPPTTKTKIVSWPALSYVPLCTLELNVASSSVAYSNVVSYGYYGITITSFQKANDDYGLDVYTDGIYWRYDGGLNLDHSSVWWWVHRMPAQ